MTNLVLSICAFLALISTTSTAQTPPAFQGTEKWKACLTAATITSLPSLYSTDPPARFIGKEHKPMPDISPETDFWQKLVASGGTGFEANTVEEADQKDLHIVVEAVSVEDSNNGWPANGLRQRAARMATAGRSVANRGGHALRPRQNAPGPSSQSKSLQHRR